MIKYRTMSRVALTLAIFTSLLNTTVAQTDQDAVMMAKNNLCTGVMYGNSSWKDYWEGTLKRDNQNLGTVSTNMYSLMGTYGICNKFNAIFEVPYIQTKTSAGTMHGQQGIQDLSLSLKWKFIEIKGKKGTLSGLAIGGGSLPLTNYIADYLPMAIGSQSKTLTGRLMADYQYGSFFATVYGAYTYRSNIKIDRTSYYTTELILSNEVQMPDVATYGLRAGYRTSKLTAEAILSSMYTQGGFDIRRNDMPFPSNEMDDMALGVNVKYQIPMVAGLSVGAGGSYVLQGRNVGQATSFDFGINYIFDFSKKANETNSNESSDKNGQK